MNRIQAKKHKIGTYEIDEILLSCFHDKRFVLDDGIYTLLIFIKIVSQVVRKIVSINNNNDNNNNNNNNNSNNNNDNDNNIIKTHIQVVL